jgi:predicted metal-dependent hydrolase
MLIEMEGFTVTLQRKRVKNINLRIQRTGEVHLSAPRRTPLNVIYSFLHKKCSWIEMHRNRLQKLEQEVPHTLTRGEYVNFQGISYELQIHETLGNQGIELSENQLHLFVSPAVGQADKQELLTQWYHAQMKQHLPALLDKWQLVIGVTITKVSIKRMKSRWGSCHPIKKHIVLNLRLIEKPLICLEYIIVHELVHLLEASHNQRFYALMDHYLPDWQEIKKKL